MGELGENVYESALKAASYIEEQGIDEVEVGLILGSGLGELADEIENRIVIPYQDIPSFPISTVEGHKGQLVYGTLGSKKVLALQGRFHYYEGYSMDTVTFPVRVMKALKTESLIVTNAAGGVNEAFAPGDLMLITDHINFFGTNPLIGENNSKFGPRFPDLSEAYDAKYRSYAKETAEELDIDLKEGIYFGVTGPSYESPAEVKMVRKLGGDAVGMSTVPEVIIARHSGIRVLGVTAITNYAAGMGRKLDHEDVIGVSAKIRVTFKEFITQTLNKI